MSQVPPVDSAGDDDEEGTDSAVSMSPVLISCPVNSLSISPLYSRSMIADDDDDDEDDGDDGDDDCHQDCDSIFIHAISFALCSGKSLFLEKHLCLSLCFTLRPCPHDVFPADLSLSLSLSPFLFSAVREKGEKLPHN